MALREYLAEEVGEDWVDGLITRREALHRLGLLGLSMAAASTLLAACAAAASPPAGTASATPTAAAVSAPASSSAGASAGTAAVSSAPGSSAAGRPISGQAITFPGPRGELQAFYSPAAQPAGAMLVIHENRGLTDHIRSVATRLASDGYSSLAVDLVSEEGGTAAVGDSANVPPILSGASDERLVTDMKAALDELARREPGAKLGMTGFCFGGGMVWAMLDAGEPRLAAAVPFYGPGPDAPDFTGDKAAVLGIYAALDSRVNGSRDRVEAALKAAGLTYQLKEYPGVDHAFFNDTGGRYNPQQAEAAYADMLAWLRTQLA